MKENFKSWIAPLPTISQAVKGEEVGSVGWIWFLSVQDMFKVWGWEVVRKMLFPIFSFCVRFSQLLASLFFLGLWVCELGSGLGV